MVRANPLHSPFMIATEAFLGCVRRGRSPSTSSSPAGNYFGGELKPCRSGSPATTRAPVPVVPGRPNNAAVTTRAGASLAPQLQADALGHDQVLFLDPTRQLDRGTWRHERVLRDVDGSLNHPRTDRNHSGRRHPQIFDPARAAEVARLSSVGSAWMRWGDRREGRHHF